jgi:phosphate starvation-inducible membrane PsiE
MIDFHKAVTPEVIMTTIAIIIIVIGVAIVAVKKFKKEY